MDLPTSTIDPRSNLLRLAVRIHNTGKKTAILEKVNHHNVQRLKIGLDPIRNPAVAIAANRFDRDSTTVHYFLLDGFCIRGQNALQDEELAGVLLFLSNVLLELDVELLGVAGLGPRRMDKVTWPQFALELLND